MTYQASKKTDVTVDLIWWGSLRLAPIKETTQRYMTIQTDYTYVYTPIYVYHVTLRYTTLSNHVCLETMGA